MNQKNSDNKYKEVKDFLVEANRLQSGIVNGAESDLNEFLILFVWRYLIQLLMGCVWFIVILSILLPSMFSTGSIWVSGFSLFFIYFACILSVPFIPYIQTRNKMRAKEIPQNLMVSFKRKVIAFSVIAGVVVSLIFYLSIGFVLKLVLFLINLF